MTLVSFITPIATYPFGHIAYNYGWSQNKYFSCTPPPPKRLFALSSAAADYKVVLLVVLRFISCHSGGSAYGTNIKLYKLGSCMDRRPGGRNSLCDE